MYGSVCNRLPNMQYYTTRRKLLGSVQMWKCARLLALHRRVTSLEGDVAAAAAAGYFYTTARRLERGLGDARTYGELFFPSLLLLARSLASSAKQGGLNPTTCCLKVSLANLAAPLALPSSPLLPSSLAAAAVATRANEAGFSPRSRGGGDGGGDGGNGGRSPS